MKRSRYLSAIILLVFLSSLSISAAESPVAPAKPTLTLTFTQRIRIETSDNVTWLAADSLAGSSCVRNRTSLLSIWKPAAKFEFALKLTNELRYHFVPEKKKTEFDQLFVDQLYARIDSVGHRPLNVVVGRQNIDFGEGFVVMDGGPLDGSRSAYFNALRLDWTMRPAQTLTAIAAYLPRWDGLLPVLHEHNRYKAMVEQSELAFMLHFSRPLATGTMQAYYLRKQATAYKTAPRIDLNCLGSRVKIPVISKLTATAEAAIQFGRRAGQDQLAFGSYAYTEYATGLKRLLPKSITLGGLFLSGDRFTTDKYEGWDPMWGRWPKWSESYVYALIKERTVAYWSNLASLFVRTAVEISPMFDLGLDFHHLTAPRYSNPSLAFPGGTGRTRGNLVILKLTYKADKNLTGHVLYENFDPGDFYTPTASPYGWLRMEVMLKF